jgi:hypothetical protein
MLHRRAEPARRPRQRATVPDYHGANWATFEDCIGDMVREQAGATALLLVGVDGLLRSNLHAFVRSVHLLLDVVADVERANSEGF